MSNHALLKSDAPTVTATPCGSGDEIAGPGAPRGGGLDPRRARMVREVADFGVDLRATVEFGRLLAAVALGSVLTFTLTNPEASTAKVSVGRSVAMPLAATPAGDVAAEPAERDGAELLAPPGGTAPALADTPQRDVHSDGGGH
jgi:hypothetical protein